MNNRRKTYTILAILTGIALLIRLYKLGSIPSGLYVDEASQGYSAYSILKTGKDEFGKTFPILFRSFADFKTPIYTYLIVPLIPIFGLTPITVRFPSFFFSVLTLPILFFLIQEMTSKKYRRRIGFLTLFLLSISPWHILFGRAAFESNIALFFMLSGILFFYRGLKNPKTFLLSAIFFALSITSYHSQRITIPIVILFLVVHYRRRLFIGQNRDFLVGSAVLFFFILLPTLLVSRTPGFWQRAGLNILNYSKSLPSGYLNGYKGFSNLVINNPIILSSREFFSLYLSYLSPRNMFLLGDSDIRSSFPETTTFFLWQFPFYVIGLYFLIKTKDLGELRFLTLLLLFITPLPAALTRDPYSTIRSLPLVIPQIIIIGFGMLFTFKIFIESRKGFRKGWINLLVSYSLLLVFTYSIIRLYSSVIILNEYFRAENWNYGYKETVDVIEGLDPKFNVIFDNSRIEPYSQLTFFLKFDPATYQKENYEVDTEEYYTNMQRNKTKKIGNITTRPIDWNIDLESEQYLIGDSLAISDQQMSEHSLQLIKKIYYHDGRVAFIIVKTPRHS